MNNKMKKNVIFIHDHKFLKDDNGVFYSDGKITDNVLSRYLALGERVIVISRVISLKKFAKDKLTKLGCDIFDFKPIAGETFGAVFGSNIFRNISKFKYYIKDCRAVVIRMPCFLSLMAYPIVLIYKKKYFIEVVGFPKEAVKGKGENIIYTLIGMFMHSFMKVMVRNADGVVYVSRKTLQNEFPSNNLVAGIPNVELVFLPEVIRDYEIIGSIPKIGLIGSYSVNYKGIDTAIVVVSKLKLDGINCDLHILGAGNAEPYLKLAQKLRCSDRVHFDGLRSGGKDVALWLDGLDIYFQPSRTEGMPRALIEAMSRGLPIVASDVGSIPEIIESKYLCNPEDVDCFYLKIKNFILSSDSRKMCGKVNLISSKAFDFSVLYMQRKLFWDTANKIIDENN